MMPDAPHIPDQITIEKCPCPYPRCPDHHLKGIGHFVQGSGFDRAEAQVVASLPDLYRALEASNKYLIGERDAFYDGCSTSSGEVPDPDDRAALAELDAIINANQAALAKYVEADS